MTTSPQHISPDDLRALMEDGAEPHVSLHLPMERRGPETRKNPIELKNGLAVARDLLSQREVPDSTIDQCLRPAEALLGEHDFWQQQQTSLALFLGPDAFHPFVLDVPVEARVGVGDHFRVLPLLAAMDRTARAYVLVLSEKHARLYRWRPGRLEAVDVPDLPANQEEALQLDPEQSLQHHPVTPKGNRSGPQEGFHGQSGGKDTELEYKTEYFHRVDAAVAKLLQKDPAPLVLATVGRNFSLYQKVNSSDQLTDSFIEGNYDHASDSELENLLAEELAGRHREAVQAGLRDLREAEGEGLASDDFNEIVKAAHEGRLGRLYLAWPPARVTGHWREDRFVAELDEKPDPQHDDLLDLAAAETWRQGGEVRFVPADRWGREVPCVGALRWKSESEA